VQNGECSEGFVARAVSPILQSPFLHSAFGMVLPAGVSPAALSSGGIRSIH